MTHRILKVLAVAAFGLASAGSWATPVTADIFYTTYTAVSGTGITGTHTYRVWSSTLSYDGASTLSISTPYGISSTTGADGIAQNPQNSDLLIVGGQGVYVHSVSKSTGAYTSIVGGSGVSPFHLEVDTATHGFTTGIPGSNIGQFSVAASGALTAGTPLTPTSGSGPVTQIIDTPSGYYYTNAGTSGTGSFGSIAFSGSTYATTTLRTGLTAAHGGVYDPYSGDIILFGDNHITQIDIGTAATVADLTVTGADFDQGTVDGAGHIFVANNNGKFTFVDYSASPSSIGGYTFIASPFLISTLDDVAPLVGSGSTTTAVPAPGGLALLGLGLFVLGVVRHRRSQGTMGSDPAM